MGLGGLSGKLPNHYKEYFLKKKKIDSFFFLFFSLLKQEMVFICGEGEASGILFSNSKLEYVFMSISTEGMGSGKQKWRASGVRCQRG